MAAALHAVLSQEVRNNEPVRQISDLAQNVKDSCDMGRGQPMAFCINSKKWPV